MLKSELETKLAAAEQANRELSATNRIMQREADDVLGELGGYKRGLANSVGNQARVREAIETVVATRWPEVDLNTTAYGVSMQSTPIDRDAFSRAQLTNKAEWEPTHKPQECGELSLLRHLHRLAH